MIRNPAFLRFGDYGALILSVIVLILSIPGFGDSPIYTSARVLFYLTIPGYAFTRAFFTDSPFLDKITMVIAYSMAISTITIAFVDVFMTELGAPPIAFLVAISGMLIAYVIVRDRQGRSQ